MTIVVPGILKHLASLYYLSRDNGANDKLLCDDELSLGRIIQNAIAIQPNVNKYDIEVIHSMNVLYRNMIQGISTRITGEGKPIPSEAKLSTAISDDRENTNELIKKIITSNVYLSEYNCLIVPGLSMDDHISDVFLESVTDNKELRNFLLIDLIGKVEDDDSILSSLYIKSRMR